MSDDVSDLEDVDLATDNLIPMGEGQIQAKPPPGMSRPSETLYALANHCLRSGDLEMAARILGRLCLVEMAEIADLAGSDTKLERELLRNAERRQKLLHNSLKAINAERDALLRHERRTQPSVQQTVVNTTGAVQVNTAPEPKPEPVISERQRAWQEKTAALKAKVA